MTDVRLTEPSSDGAGPPAGRRRWSGPGLRLGGAVVVIGLLLLAAGGLSLDHSWRAAQATVHAVRGPGVHVVTLDARRYEVYADAAAGGGATSTCLTVTGPIGVVPVRSVRYGVSPYDPANVILQTGVSFPTAEFTVASTAAYEVRDGCLPVGHRAFVAEAQGGALRHVAFGVLAVGAGVVVTLVGLGRLRRVSPRRRAPRYLTVVADTSPA